MGHDGVASGYLTPIGFRMLTSYQWDPRDKGATPLPYVPSPGPIHSYLYLKYENKMNNYSP